MYKISDGWHAETAYTLDEAIEIVGDWYEYLNDDDGSIVDFDGDGIETVKDLNAAIATWESKIAESCEVKDFAGHGSYYVSGADRMGLDLRVTLVPQLIGWVEKSPDGDLRYCEQMAEIDEDGATGTSGAYCLDDYDRESCEELLGLGVTIKGVNPYHSDAIVVASFVCE